MAMDKQVDKPEAYGLPAGWSGYVGGMMTLVRVLHPDQYEKIMDLKARQRAQAPQENSAK
jgi:manganese oxidase